MKIFSSRPTVSKLFSTMAKPKFIAFDLDCTLWPWHLDTHVDPPFHKGKDGNIYDRYKHKVVVYPDVPQMLRDLKAQGFILGAASRTTEVKGGHQLLELLGWTEYLTHREIYPGQKLTHFEEFHNKTGIAYKDMLFFDDEYRNIRDVSRLGVTCVFVDSGMTNELLAEGFAQFAKNNL